MMPYAPISLIVGDLVAVEQALLDTGAAVNVLP